MRDSLALICTRPQAEVTLAAVPQRAQGSQPVDELDQWLEPLARLRAAELNNMALGRGSQRLLTNLIANGEKFGSGCGRGRSRAKQARRGQR